MRNMLNNKVGAVVAGALTLVLMGGVGGAFAASKITGADIKNGSVGKADLGKASVGWGAEFNQYTRDKIKSLAGQDGADGQDGTDGKNGAPGAQGPAGPAGASGKDGAQGPAGPAGQDGAQGPAGPAGQDGTDGVSGYEVHNREVLNPAGENYQIVVPCPAGKVALGGGFSSDNPTGVDVNTTQPRYNSTTGLTDGWIATYDSTVRTGSKAWVICASVN